MIDKISEFSDSSSCVKCGKAHTIKLYRKEKDEEYLYCKCNYCGYDWVSRTADYICSENKDGVIIKNNNGKIKVITLCGSLRFESAFHYWNEILTLQKYIVISVSVLPSIKNGKNWYTDEQKQILDEVHCKKIDLADAIFVIDQPHSGTQSYIGESTQREIEHAKKTFKQVYFASKSCNAPGCGWRFNNIGPCSLCYE
jgi:DNA-directed RNA polymerase subunit RPC12/RpoP